MTIDEHKVDCQDCMSDAIKECTEKPRKKNDVIKAVNHMARASGMSYGKFVAQMSMKPLERKRLSWIIRNLDRQKPSKLKTSRNGLH